MTFTFTHDPESGAIYIRLREGEIAETVELADGCFLDIGADRAVLGLECLSLEELREFIELQGGKLELPEMWTAERHQVDPRLLREALEALPSAHREVLMLRFRQGLPVDEVADMLGVSIATAYRRQRAALAELRIRLREGESDADERSLEESLAAL